MTSEPAAIDLLLRDHGDFVDRLARRLLADRDAAEDLRQRAWQTVLEQRPRGVVDFRAWITGLCRNLARMHVRGEAARRRREQMRAAVQVERPADTVARLDELERLVQALRRLREPFRTAVLLRYREDLAPRMIARRTGVNVATVKSRLKRGLAMLREDLRDLHGGDPSAWRRGLLLLVVRPAERSLPRLLPAGAAALAVLGGLAALLASPGADRPPAPRGTAVAPAPPAALAVGPAGSATVRLELPAQPAPGSASGRHAVRLVDAATGEPLPGFVVAAEALDPPLLTTDGEGLLRLSAPGGRAVTLHLLDDLRLRSEQPFAAALMDGALRVRVGPTYGLDLQPPAGAGERFDARLTAADPDRQHRACFAPVRTGAAGAATGATGHWVRFPPDALHCEGGPPWRLEVRSDDGYWFGAAEVGTAQGVHPGRVPVALAPTGRVHGRIEQPDGRPVDQAAVLLTAGGVDLAGVTDREGAFDLCWIPPGTWTLRASSRRHLAAETTVVVQARASGECTLQLRPVAGAGVIEGALLSDAGALAPPPPGPVAVVLTHCEDPDLVFLRTVVCAAAPADGRLGAFRFEGVPAGRYGLAVRAGDFHRWDPAVLRVAPGQTGVELRRRDTAPHRGHTLAAVSAVTGRPLAEFDAFVRLDGDDRTAKVLAARDGAVLLPGVPLDAAIEWIVRAPGHVPRRGDRGGLGEAARLEPGWGNTLHCTDRAGRPVAGVPFALDGVPAGATDGAGRLLLRRPDAPARIGLRAGTWTLAGGDLRPDGGYRDLIWGIAVTVETASPPQELHHEERR